MKVPKLLFIILIFVLLDVLLLLDTNYLNGDLISTKNPTNSWQEIFFSLILYILPILVLFHLSRNSNKVLSRKLKLILESILVIKIILAYFLSYGLVGTENEISIPFIIRIFLPPIGRVQNIVILSALIFNSINRKECIKYFILFTILSFVTHSFLPLLILFLGLITRLSNKAFLLSVFISVFVFFSSGSLLNSIYKFRDALRNDSPIENIFENNQESIILNKIVIGRLTGFSSWLYYPYVEDKILILGKTNNTNGLEVFADLLGFLRIPNGLLSVSESYTKGVDPYAGNSYGIMMGSFLPSIYISYKLNPIVSLLFIVFLSLCLLIISISFKAKRLNISENAIFICLYFAFISGSLYEILNLIISIILINLYTKIKLWKIY